MKLYRRLAFLGPFVALALVASCSGAENKLPADGPATPDAEVDGADAGADPDAPVALDDAAGVDAASLPPTTAVRIIVEPSDDGQGLVNAIAGAKKSVHMTMYMLSSTAVINALIAQKNLGHDVKVVLNKTFVQGAGSNQSVYSQLVAAHVSVAWAPAGFTLTHEKCVVIDGVEAWIMTMNATQTSPSENREYLAVDSDPADVAEADAIFAADFANQAIVASGKLVVSPDNAQARIAAFAKTATKSIDIEGEVLSDYVLVNVLTAKGDAGVAVRIVLASTTPSTAQSQAVAKLKQHKVQIVSLATPYVHAKTLVVDGTTAYVGSENFTTASLVYNRELGVIFALASEVAKIETTMAADFAAGTAL